MKSNIPLFYYTLQDIQYSTPSPSFGIKGAGDLKAVNPLFSLSCPKVSYFFPFVISFFLSPLLLLLVYNVSVISWVVLALIAAFSGERSEGSLSHTLQPAAPYNWNAQANGM